MSLSGSRLEISLDLLEDLVSSFDNLLLETGNFTAEFTFSEMPLENISEDNLKSLLVKVDITNLVEVTSDTRSDVGTTTSWFTHSGNKVHLLKMSERMLVVLSIIPSTLVNPLSEDLDGRLSTILFDLRHVQVIDKDNTLHANSRSEVILSQLG